jgi:hypothetical protein
MLCSVSCLTTNWMTRIQSPAKANYFSSSFCVQTSSEAHPAYPMGTGGGGPFPGGKARPGCDADHSPPSAEVKNE